VCNLAASELLAAAADADARLADAAAADSSADLWAAMPELYAADTEAATS
jgi:hypothetical protein